jgi:hypothetical protein
MKWLTVMAVGALFLFAVSPVQAEEATQPVQEQIQALQNQLQSLKQQSEKQMEVLQSQIDLLKQQLATQKKEKEELMAQINEKKPKYASLISWGKSWRMRKEEGLEKEAPINISGEVAIQYKTQTRSGSSSSEGFRAYEIPELFIDATVNDYVTAFAELPLAYEGGGIELEDGWIDIHKPLELAASGDTGLKIGQFHVPFGWDNQDNEGYVYGGRSIVNPPYSRNKKLEGISLYHSRRVGLQANYKLSLEDLLKLETENPLYVIFSAGVFNGTGGIHKGQGSEWDNDNVRDVAGRIEAHFLNAVLGGSIWSSPATKNATSDSTASNTISHTRDILSYGVHFKYPDVPFPGEDITMGGSKYLIWGEWFWRKAEEANVAGEGDTKTRGAYLEFDYSLTPTLVAVVREDYYDPDTSVSNDRRYETTLGVKWEFIKNCELFLNYVTDNFHGATEGDGIAAMFKTKF